MQKVTKMPQRFPLRPIILTLLLLAVVIVVLAVFNSGILPEKNTASLAIEKQSTTLRAAPDVSSTQETIPTPVIISIVEMEWVEIGQVRNGEEVLALLSWDRIVIDKNPAVAPVDEIISLIRLGRFSLPPATSRADLNPLSEIVGYLLENNTIILYAYSDYHWSEQDPHGVTYWQAEVPLATNKRLSP